MAYMKDDDERTDSFNSDDDIEVAEVRYDLNSRHELSSSTSLAVILPEQWGKETTDTHYGVQADGQGYTVRAEFAGGGFLGLWGGRYLQQSEEAVGLHDAAGLRITWSPDRLRARATFAETSVLVSGDGIEAAQFETLLRSLWVVDS
jgi:hypothetical protein